MEKLKSWTEEYLRIESRFDGGRTYTWQQAKIDLDMLFDSISKGMPKIHTPWIRKLAFLLKWYVKEESNRVWALYR